MIGFIIGVFIGFNLGIVTCWLLLVHKGIAK